MAHESAAVGQRWLTPRKAMVVVLIVSGLLHLLMACSSPLILTPNSQEYIEAANALVSTGELKLTAMRTPGYTFMLAGIFSFTGPNPIGVLLAQHAAGVAICCMLAWCAGRLGGARVSVAVGVAAAADPWLLSMGNYALDEIPTVLFIVGAAGVALCCRSARWRVGLMLGALLAGGCLMRPVVQVMVPLIAGAWVVGLAVSWRRRAVMMGAVAVGFVVTAGPWLAYNANRGVTGFARGSGLALWYGVAMFHELDPAYPIDDATRASFNANVAESHAEGDHWVMKVLWETKAETSAGQNALLGKWALASVRKRPAAYVGNSLYCLLWQLDVGIRGKPPIYDEMHMFLRRLSRGGGGNSAAAPNFQGAGAFPGWPSFVMHWRGGLLEKYLLWFDRSIRGWPQVPLLVCALACGVLGVLRKEWGLVLVVTAGLALVAANCALLASLTRYSMPAWTVWYICPAALVAQVRSRAGSFRRDMRESDVTGV